MKLALLFTLFFTTIAFSQELAQVRTAYATLENDTAKVEVLYNTLQNVSEKNNTLSGYKGAIMVFKADAEKGIKNKKFYFKEGVMLLENALTKDSNNIELRTLRLGIQENAPRFLKYNDDIAQDKQFILEHYKATPSKAVRDFVKGYVMQSTIFSDEEKALF